MAAKKRKAHRAKKSGLRAHAKKDAKGFASLSKRVSKLETLVKKSGLSEHYGS